MSNSPAEDSARTWTRVLAGYREPSRWRSVFELGVTIVPFVVLWAAAMAAVAYGHWWGLALTVPAAGFLLRLFVIQHDCGHGAFFPTRRANDWVGRILGVLTVTPYGYRRRTHGISPTPAPSVEHSAKVAILKDAGGEVTIERDGRITGLDKVSENSRQYVARAALSEQIAPADVLRHLSGQPGGLRSNDDGPQGFRLLYPVRRVVTEARPVFRWESLPGVSSYRVYVLDQDGNQVSQSEELGPTQTQWEVSALLRRGQIFSWVVTALVDGKKVVSPSASAPEIKFAVLSTADFQELSHLKKSNSHLALGVFYARVGLLSEAEREFEDLVKLNPQSELPRKLLHSVRTIRKAK
jgi:hypothetical protein